MERSSLAIADLPLLLRNRNSFKTSQRKKREIVSRLPVGCQVGQHFA
jgi:hypothetical protein